MRLSRIRERQKEISEKQWFPAALFVYDLALAAAAVLPLMLYVIHTVPFCYEVNDDATVVQFLDGSYTGTPEAHAFYIRYPLSWLIARLYETDPSLPGWLWSSDIPGTDLISPVGTNWYLFVVSMLTVFAMIAVLYRLLKAFGSNRLVICVLFDLAVGLLWMPHFSCMTFTTAAAFMGVMGIAFFGFLDQEEAWRPWNLIILVILLGSCWCLRRQCFMMVIPFIAVIFLLKYRTELVHSWRPWLCVLAVGIMLVGLIQADRAAYGSDDWQAYRAYNSERSWLQDYDRIPTYEGNEEFYQSIGMGEDAVGAFRGYTYCMTEGFSPAKVHAIYEYASSKQKSAEGSGAKTLLQRAAKALHVAVDKFREPENISALTSKTTAALWLSMIPLLILTIAAVSEDRWRESAVLLSEILLMGALTAGEWVYLMMNGRFPQRVEETIWLLTFCVAAMLAGHILLRLKDLSWCRLPGAAQILLLILLLRFDPLPDAVSGLQDEQLAAFTRHSRKAEVLEYCAAHPDDRYVLRTTSFARTSTPYDDLHQGNWFMSGSWAAYSPLYYEKLAAEDTGDLSADFLARSNVYIITKGKANISHMTGRGKENPVRATVADSLTTSDGTEFLIYKVY